MPKRASTLLLAVVLLTAPGPSIADPAEESPPAEPSFSFIVVADPHITGRKESDRRLNAAIRWINENRKSRRIDLVFIVGDLAWRKGQAVRARKMLEALEAPWFPLIGDNELSGGGYEREFHLAFALQHRRLAKEIESYRVAPAPVRDPGSGRAAFLQNFRLDHKGIRFVGLDWVTRAGGDSADLHDYPGGTWRWLTEAIESAPTGPRERLVMLSHLPMHRNIVYEVFSEEEFARVSRLMRANADLVYANFAGHYHFDWWESKAGGAYNLFVADATWDDKNTVRLVSVSREGGAFRYRQKKIEIP